MFASDISWDYLCSIPRGPGAPSWFTVVECLDPYAFASHPQPFLVVGPLVVIIVGNIALVIVIFLSRIHLPPFVVVHCLDRNNRTRRPKLK